jgi:hypothetical protein
MMNPAGDRLTFLSAAAYGIGDRPAAHNKRYPGKIPIPIIPIEIQGCKLAEKALMFNYDYSNPFTML